MLIIISLLQWCQCYCFMIINSWNCLQLYIIILQYLLITVAMCFLILQTFHTNGLVQDCSVSSTRLQYLQCISTGDTTVLHEVLDILFFHLLWLGLNGLSSQLVIVVGTLPLGYKQFALHHQPSPWLNGVQTQYYYIEVRTKWPTFCRWHF